MKLKYNVCSRIFARAKWTKRQFILKQFYFTWNVNWYEASKWRRNRFYNDYFLCYKNQKKILVWSMLLSFILENGRGKLMEKPFTCEHFEHIESKHNLVMKLKLGCFSFALPFQFKWTSMVIGFDWCVCVWTKCYARKSLHWLLNDNRWFGLVRKCSIGRIRLGQWWCVCMWQ